MGSVICEDLRVLDLSRSMSGALATMVLADAGAEVIKIEAPEGDPTRRHYASVMWHRGKKSVALDLKTAQGQADLHRLIRGSDLLVHTYRPGVDKKLGADYETASRINRSLVYCGISGFGPLKPLESIKGYDGIVSALTGRFYQFRKQIDKGGPVFSALPVASFGAAMLALQGIMATLYVREKTGRGRKVATSLLQSLAVYDWNWLVWQFDKRGINPRKDWPDTEPTPQYFVARTKDGRWLQMANAMHHLFVNWLVGIGMDDVLTDPRYAQMPVIKDKKAEEELYRRMFQRMGEKRLDEWMHLFMTEVDAASEPFMHTLEGFGHPQVLHNGNVITIQDPEVGPTKQVGPLVRFSETPLEPHGPAPRLGQHTEEVLGSIDGRTRGSRNGRGRKAPARPLAGVTILDFASWVAVPLGPAMLADLGARVIKVEPLGGDPWRGFGPMGLRTHQGKESVALDLKHPEGRKIAHQLICRADILAHNLRPGVPQRLGVDYETARNLNPKIIYLYGAGYGSTGPYSHRSVMHPIPGAVAGGALYQAGRDMPPSPDIPLSYEEIRRVAKALSVANEGSPDISSSLVVASALLMALYVRERTGKGQYLETSMICSNLYANSDDAIQYQGKPSRLLPDPELNGLHALYRMYRARDGWVFLVCTSDEEWLALCRAIDCEELLADPRFATEEARMRHQDDLSRVLAAVFAQRGAREWQELLTHHDVACVEIYGEDFSEFANTHPWMKEYGLVVEREHPSVGKYLRYGEVINFSESSPSSLGPMTYIGEHTARVLKELGYGQDEIRDLGDRKVVLCHPGP